MSIYKSEMDIEHALDVLRLVDADLLSVFAFSFESNDTFNFREKCVISTSANIVARMNFCAALTNENAARRYGLAVRSLDAESLGRTVTTVFRATNTLFTREQLQIKLNKHQIPPPQ
jgi:ABC-type cobalamin/Fe3+-siderophores transport system ATPase subunit